MLSAASPAAAAGPPQIQATWVTDVSATAAVLHAEVKPEGLASGYRFEYLTEAAYEAAGESFAGAQAAPPFGEEDLGAGESAEPAVQQVEGLAPATAYRYRVVAANAAAPQGVIGPTLAFTTQPSGGRGPEECPNAALRAESHSLALPDCRAWEMASPLEKNGGAIQGFGAIAGGGVLQAAQGGALATFSSSASFGAGAQGAPLASQYIARRTAAGWQTESITPATQSGAYGEAAEGVPYQLFSPDLGRALLLNGARCAPAGPCSRSYSLRESQSGSLAVSPQAPDLRFVGASPDTGAVVLATCAALTPEASEAPLGGGCDPAEPNLYAWDGGALRLLNVLPGHSQGTPGARLGAQAGAVSADGTRAYFTELQDGAIYLSEAGAPTRLLPQSGGAVFQTASSDGTLAFFTKAETLYRYDAEAQASQAIAAGVEGVLGASADGAYVYYATPAGVFLWHGGASVEVAPGAEAATPGDYPPASATARVSADGIHLAFLSKASLTGYDNTDQQTGEPDTELYLYGATAGGSLACVSCNPTGARPLGASSIPGAIANGAGGDATALYKPRVLSASSGRLFFDSRDALLSADTSAAPDVYEWEAPGEGSCRSTSGCLALISGGASGEASSFIDASADGRDAFFLTGDSLVPTDPGSVDLYDARVEGGFPVPPAPTPCEGDACQAVPSPPEDPALGTAVAGRPNPPLRFPKRHPHKPKHRHRGKRG